MRVIASLVCVSCLTLAPGCGRAGPSHPAPPGGAPAPGEPAPPPGEPKPKAGTGAAADPDPRSDLGRLQGKWIKQDAEVNGADGGLMKLFMKDGRPPVCDQFVFDKGLMRCLSGDEKVSETPVRLAPDRNPKEIDLLTAPK